MNDNVIFRATAIFLFVICVISLLPLVVLVFEFGDSAFCGEAVWSYVAKLYGSYFIFPIFGVIVAVFLFYPLAIALMILREYRQPLIYIAAFWLVFTVGLSAIEFFGSPRAVFEVAPQTFHSAQGELIYGKLATICAPETFAYKMKFDAYQKDLDDLVKAGRSYSSYVYYVAIPAQVGLHSTLLCVFLLIIYLKKPFIDNYLSQQGFNRLRANFFLCFGLALSLGAVWCIYRLSYRFDHALAFGGMDQTNKLYVDYLIFGLYFVVIAIYIVFAGLDLEKTAKTMSQIALVVGVLGFSAAVPTGYASAFFGTKASIFNFIGMFILLLILIALGLLIGTPPPPLRQRPEPEDG